MYLCIYVWVGGCERTCMHMHIICVIVYHSSCDDTDISDRVIATCCYGTMVTMLSWYCSYLYLDIH